MRRQWVQSKIAVWSLAMAGGAAGCSDPSTGGPVAGSGGDASLTTGGSAGAAGGGAANSGATSGGTASAGATGGGGSSNTPRVCDIQAPTECVEPSPTYADVEPIFASRCVVCHGANPGAWPLNSYGHVASWRDTIRAALLTCAMPPAEAQMSLPKEESLLILHWIRCGMPP